MPPSFTFVPGRSPLLAGALIGTHVAAGALALAAPIDWRWRLAIAIGVCLSLVHSLREQGWWSGAGIARVELRADGSARLVDRHGRMHEARLTRSTMVTPWLVILVLATGRLRPARTVVVPADSLPSDDFRRLRVWLRWTRTEPASPLN
jgi:toxin CptA